MKTQAQKIFVNSLPKSGTHLLAKAVELFGYREHFDPEKLDDPERITPLFFNYREVQNAIAAYEASKQPGGATAENTAETDAIYVGTVTPVYATADHFRHWFSAMDAGRYVLGHVGYSPALSQMLAESGVRHLFIIRDPRAVVASLLSFILDTRGMPRPHFLQADFEVMTPKQRLDLLLEGGYAPKAAVDVVPFAEVYRTMVGWQADPSCLVVRFEELVGPQGGGTVEQQLAVGAQISAHLGVSFSEPIAARFGEIYSPKSRTFREGRIDGWQDELDAEAVARVQQYCQPLLQSAKPLIERS
ncbi:MAG: hypothetical protein KDE19_16155 [Caldilineaceae bacterium]|nr:hypothetical protein [Caldilineaceae bacterium]